MILVGDSGGMVALGYTDTVPVSMEEMIHPCIYLKVIWKSIPKHVKCKKITNHPNIFKTTYSKFLMKMRCPLIDGF
jgi:hypothetical protein